MLHKLAEDTYVPCMANHLYVGKMQPGCAFYDFDNQCCSIYEDRPGVCRNFPFVFLKKPKINGESEELRLLEREGEEYLGVLDSRTQGIGKGQEYGEEGLKEVQDKYLSLQIKRSEEFRETIEHYQNLLEDIEEDYVPLAGVEGVLVHKHDSYIRTGYEET